MFKVLLEMSSWIGDNYKGVPGTEPPWHPGSHSSHSFTASGTEQGDSKTNPRAGGGALRKAEDGAELHRPAKLQE